MIGVIPMHCHPEARVLCELENLCNSHATMRLRASCIGPRGRKKRLPQDDKNLGSKFEGPVA